MSSDTPLLSLDNTPPPYRGGCPLSSQADLSTCQPVSAPLRAATSASRSDSALLISSHGISGTTRTEAQPRAEVTTAPGNAFDAACLGNGPRVRTASWTATSRQRRNSTTPSRSATHPSAGSTRRTSERSVTAATADAPGAESSRGIDVTAILAAVDRPPDSDGFTSRSGALTWA